MLDQIQSIARPGRIVAALACLVFPFAWNHWQPVVSGDPVLVILRDGGELRDRASGLRAESSGGRSRGAVRVQRYRFDLDLAGRYSVYGVSNNRDAEPVMLRVDGRAVSATAFYPRQRRGLARDRVATSLDLAQGSHSVEISGRRLHHRALALELRRERPLGVARYLLLALACAGVFVSRTLIASRIAVSPRARLAVVATGFAIALVALPWALYALSSGRLIALGEQDSRALRALRSLDRQLASPEQSAARAAGYSIAVLGDSTHFYALGADDRLVPALNRALPESERKTTYFWGAAAYLWNAFDFYLLLNRIADAEPDLVVLPVNLRSFSDSWLHAPVARFGMLDHFVQARELPRTRSLSVAGREIPLVGWTLGRIDGLAFDGALARLLRGANAWFDAERARIENSLQAEIPADWQPLPAALRQPIAHSRWAPPLAPDHELFDAYRMINDFAARRGITVLYYTVPINEEVLAGRRIETHARENLARIERQIASHPATRFLTLEPIRSEWFKNELDHLEPEGIDRVARAIVERVMVFERADAPREP